MNRVLLGIALSVLVIGCSTSTQMRPTGYGRDQSVRFELRPEAQAPAQPQQRRIMPQVPQFDMLAGRPQTIGQLYSPIEGCSRGGRAITLHNGFEPCHLRVFIDGREVMPLGALGPLPTVPPGEDLYLCVTPGAHKLTAIALEPDGLTPLAGNLRTGSIRFSTGAYPQKLYMEYADFSLSD